MFRLETITLDLNIVADNSMDHLLGLFYITHSNEPLRGWLAGLPVNREESTLISNRAGIHLPSSIQEFYSIHDGLLENGNGAIGIKPLQQLCRLSEHTSRKELEADKNYARENLLEFSGDRFGNMQCFDLTHQIGKGDNLTVTWDHETHELTRPMSFRGYLKDFSIKILE